MDTQTTTTTAQGNGLYLGNLEENTSTQQINNFFNKYNLISINHQKNTSKNVMKKFAFLYFQTPQEAERCLLEMNHEKMGTKPIRLMYIQQQGQMNNKEGNLFVKNIDTSVTPKEFEEFFRNNANAQVLTTLLKTDKSGDSLGYGYVQFATKQVADWVRQNLNNTKLKENMIQIEEFLPKPQRVVVDKCNIYFKNLPKQEGIDQQQLEEQIRNMFKDYGTITSMIIKFNSVVNKPFGFICYIDNESAQKAIDAMNNTDPFKCGENIYVGWAQTKYERQRAFDTQKTAPKVNETKIFIRNLKVTTAVEQLKEVLSVYGNLNSASVKETIVKGSKLKYGIVDFVEKESAQRALTLGPSNEGLKELTEEGMEVYIKLAQTREMRQKFLKMARKNYEQKQINKMMGVSNYNQSSGGMPGMPGMPGAMGGAGQNPQQMMMMWMQFMQQFGQMYMNMNQNGQQGGYNQRGGQRQYYQQMKRQRTNKNRNQQYQNRNYNRNNQSNWQQQNGGQGQNQRMNQQNYMNQNRGGMQNNNMQQQMRNQQQMMGNMQQQTQAQRMAQGQNRQMPQQQRTPQQMTQGQKQMPTNPQQMRPQQQQAQQQQRPQQNQQQQQTRLPIQTPQVKAQIVQLRQKKEQFQQLKMQEKTQIIGSLLFPYVQAICQNQQTVRKVTGMLIDSYKNDFNSFIQVMENPELLRNIVREAEQMLTNSAQ